MSAEQPNQHSNESDHPAADDQPSPDIPPTSSDLPNLSALNLSNPAQGQADLLKLLHARNVNLQAPQQKEYKFWHTQPVPKIDESVTPSSEQGAIESKHIQEVCAEPYPLPASFVWDSVDMTDEKQVDEVYSLLSGNYVEDDDNMFRFDYSKAFLRWALMPPGFRKDWHVGVRTASNGKLVAFISGIPQKMRVNKQYVHSPLLCFPIVPFSCIFICCI